MSFYNEDKICIIEDQLWIYRLESGKKKKWYAYIKFDNHPRVRRSLKTSNIKDAEVKAKRLYFKLKAFNEENLPLENMTWVKLKKQYEKQRSVSQTTIHRLNMLNLYFAPRIKNIKDLSSNDIGMWQKWRVNFWTSKEGAQHRKKLKTRGGRYQYKDISYRTLRMEATALKSMLDFARQRGYIQHTPDIPLLKTRDGIRYKQHRRAAFTAADHRNITNYINLRWNIIKKKCTEKNAGYYASLRNGNEYMALAKRKNRRMWAWVHLLHKSGIRPQEAVGLMWCDIGLRHDSVNNTNLCEIRITEDNSKTKSSRIVYVVEFSTADKGQSDLYRILMEWKSYSLFQNDTDYVFSKVFEAEESKPAKLMFRYFSKMINQSIEEYNASNPASKLYPLKRDNEGREYSSYSYRHMYATRMLTQGVNAYHLCEMMGTSMIQLKKHYGHLMTWDLRHDFIRSQKQHNESMSRLRENIVVELKKTS